MNGLDLGRYLNLLRTDPGSMLSLGAIVTVVGMLAWSSVGTRRLLKQCLVVSLLLHVGLVGAGGMTRWGQRLLLPWDELIKEKEGGEEPRIQRIAVVAEPEPGEAGGERESGGDSEGGEKRSRQDWDLPTATEALALAVPSAEGLRRRLGEVPGLGAVPPRLDLPEVGIEGAEPALEMPAGETPGPREVEEPAGPEPALMAGMEPAEELAADRPEAEAAGDVVERRAEPAPVLAMPGRGADEARTMRPVRERGADLARLAGGAALAPLEITRNVPTVIGGVSGLRVAPRARVLPEVPEVYRSRLNPNRTALAQQAGASSASELAVARALDWLARHQDEDGRWDAATGRDSDGRVVPGEDDFTVHCPPGEVCFGECHYWEADTATTGLALLAYLGAGYTHQDGKYAGTVERGLDYLRSVQKADGDLRGSSKAVGMYCHAMAALALCEAYALTGDEALQGPAARGVDFLVKSQARDGMSWRYAPGATVGDTSILGWVILVLKSAREVKFDVPAKTQAGGVKWLRRVSAGKDGGLALYQPGEPVTPTMTAEAWVCRQFLGIGGPDEASSREAAAYLLKHPPSDEFNIYYWYYATLSLYQNGGESWERWNGAVRDAIVMRQRTEGHQGGSWDPDESRWGRYGGRIYTTALATLTLEVYYRYLRLYDAPGVGSGGR